jgi:hypothetical protein
MMKCNEKTNTGVGVKTKRDRTVSDDVVLDWFLHVSLILIIKGRYPREVSLIVIIKKVST